jgi:hypothetical protein
MSTMAKTPRNGIEYHANVSRDWLLEVDTLFEIADAELTSECSVREQFHAIRVHARDIHAPWPIAQIERLLAPHVQRIQQREGWHGSSRYGAKCVARALAALWFHSADPLPAPPPAGKTRIPHVPVGFKSLREA